ncbi:biotin transporter BioY [bacterium]|nr:biotin transporter BioY [bacterium]
MEYISIKQNLLCKKYFKLFTSLTTLKKFSLAFGFAILTGISAQFFIKLPFTTVPLTSQVLVVLCSGLLLGKTFGAISQILYLAGGSIGIRWFYLSQSGLFRHTTGYIIGFIVASYIIGFLTERKDSAANRMVSMFIGVLIILTLGTLWLSIFQQISLTKAFTFGFIPFLPLDLIKAYFAGAVINLIKKEWSLR